ncbi:hypothetical protein LTR10_016053 [Elasticomyces elasticus]|uniref:CCD97-like C-terminal domain-containing protein n=1 Tax=Exophiala sideris TaxID=1016849 RepID=A0ABR0J1I6_9EURO|nr:hypothetical protein LTR10_016053 [Elasticomyces elasticus]KAK5024610.1 hypothetical protein LTS07_008456 [Exophiala sideris]KAK5030703.1 hypothetical protein LTR13_008057 [Exophiala sideris]KAK5054243.1 hypothetical protein LTR69_008858 [Exophiala sideris]KAK5179645.1 hypothetical protein LTR44_007813 [Eurotiomycetes sp. CCFEE 6388]
MAARLLLVRLALTTRAGRPNIPSRINFVRTLRLSAIKTAPTDVISSSAETNQTVQQTHQVQILTDEARNAAFLGEADSNDGHDVYRDTYGPPPTALDAKYAAFLGEADSDDGFETRKLEEGHIHEPLDARYAAFLGEAGSDDGFEARKVEEGDKHEALDAKYAAFLGEADSDDGFEADIAANPAKYDHKIQDTSESGFHAEGGEVR